MNRTVVCEKVVNMQKTLVRVKSVRFKKSMKVKKGHKQEIFSKISSLNI